MESHNQECETCGCKDFTVDAGFYYCLECGTRSKEIQEIQYELTQGFSSVRLHTRKVKKAPSAKSKEYKLTSWEIYNYILIGLVDEILKLGAPELFKITTLQIWTAYLTKLEVAFTSKSETLIPKLPVTFKQTDAEVLYGRMRSKRKRKASGLNSSNVSLDHTSLDASLVSKQRRQEKRALIEAEYEAITGTQQSDTNSLFNSSLHTVNTESSTKSDGTLRYSVAAKRECLRHMTRKHFNKHARDQHDELKCHRRKPSEKYLKSASFVTRNCLWSILYLALNITENPIQLGDMIRYCREGNLSYFSLKHFIPEDYVVDNRIHEILHNSKYKVPCHKQIRIVATKIADIIKLRQINRPDFFLLSSRYCEELELPPFITQCVMKLSSCNTKEVKSNINKHTVIPNYEGRVMAYIVFIMKLIFGLDDYTEYNISSTIKKLNAELSKVNDYHMPIFSWSDWSSFIEFRKLVISQKHYPTKLQLDKKFDRGGQMFIDFWRSVKLVDDMDDAKMPSIMRIMKKVFTDLIRIQGEKKQPLLKFEPSLTPFKMYFRMILDNCDDFRIPHNISDKHSESDISFFMNSSEDKIILVDKKFLVKFKNEIINKNVRVVNVNKEFDSKKDLSTYKIHRNEIVKINPIGTLEWLSKSDENSEPSESLKSKIKESKRKSIVLKKELNTVKAIKQEAKEEISKLKSAKFGGHVNINVFKNVMVENTDNASLSEVIKSKYKNTISRPILLSPMRNIRGRFIGGPPSTDLTTKSKNQHRKWFVSKYTANPNLNGHDLRLDQQVLPEVVMKSKPKEIITDEIINIPRPAAQYWISHFGDVQVTNDSFQKFESKFSSSFLWLLEECARTVEISRLDLYKELVEIEKQFGLVQLPDRNRNLVT